MLRCITLLLLVGAPAVSAAQWRVAAAGDPLAPVARAFAEVRNRQGYRLQVYRDGDGLVRARLVLREGFDVVGGCPTFQVDSKPPERVSADGSSCTTAERWAEFVLGRIVNNHIVSLSLHRLLNGEQVSFRYPLKGRGYGEAVFSLARSKQAVTQALGREVRISAH